MSHLECTTVGENLRPFPPVGWAPRFARSVPYLLRTDSRPAKNGSRNVFTVIICQDAHSRGEIGFGGHVHLSLYIDARSPSF